MDDALNPQDPEAFKSWLLGRLSDIPDITWRTDVDPVHSSFSDWNVWGVYGKKEKSASPTSLIRPALKRITSSNTKVRREDAEEKGVIARVSTNHLRIERQWYFKKQLSAIDPHGDHHVCALQLFRLPGGEKKNEPTLTVLLLQDPAAKNTLRNLINYGPTWYAASDLPALKPYNPNVCSDGQTPTGRIDLMTFLRYAIGATECCELIHQRSWVHGEIRPDVFYYDQNNDKVMWINHGAGAKAVFENGLTRREWDSLSSEYGSEYRLQFVAPEQTGRFEVKPDTRTDIYGLGIVFWNMLCGALPHEGTTPLEIIQNVLSRRVPPVSSKRTDVPDALSAVIQKMVQKSMENRYHSAVGAQYDLRQIQKFLQEGESEALKNFEVGQGDQNCVFRISNALIGRDKERDAIVNVLSNVSQRQQRFWKTVGMAQTTDSGLSSKGQGAHSPLPRVSDTISESISIHSSSTGSAMRNDSVRSQEPPTQNSEGFDVESRKSLSNGGSESINSELQKYKSVDPNDPSARSVISRTLSQDMADTGSTIGTSLRLSVTNDTQISNHTLKRAQKFKREGRTEIIAVSGQEGSGKSAIVQAIKPTARRYWASSKFEPMRSPFAAVLELMSSLMRQVYMDTDVTGDFQAQMKNILTPVWPTLHQLLQLPYTLIDFGGNKIATGHLNGINSSPPQQRETSHQTEFLRTGATSKRSRFLTVFLDILRFLALRKVIVFYLDDLQFADDESIEVLQSIVKAGVPIALLLTFQTVPELSQRAQILLKKSSANVTNIELPPLTESDVSELLVQSLSRTSDYLFGLAAVTVDRTDGNPLMVREFLEFCYNKGLIYYSWSDRQWEYDLDKIIDEHDTKNVDFIVTHVRDLPPLSRTLCGWASLIGSPFSFPMIKSLMQENSVQEENSTSPNKAELVRRSSQDVVKALEVAIGACIIQATEEPNYFQFCHARYQQAVQSLPEYRDKAPEMHFKVLQYLMHSWSNKGSGFNKAAHLLASIEIVKSRVGYRKPYRDILSFTASQTIESGGRTSALQCLKGAMRLLQDDPWNEEKMDCNYLESLKLHIRTAECYWTQGYTDDALDLLEKSLKHARSAFDKVPSCVLRSRIAAKSGDHVGTYQILKQALAELNTPMPEMSWQACDKKFHELATRVEELSAEGLTSRPLEDDLNLNATTTLLAEILSPSFWTDTLQYYSISLAFIALVLDSGPTAHAGLAFVAFSACAIGRHHKVSLGCKSGRIAKLFFEVHGDDYYTVGRGAGLQCILSGWFETHIHNLVPIVDDALNKSLAADDMNFALVNAGFSAAMRLWASYDASEVESFCLYSTESFSDWTHDPRGGLMLTSIRQFVRAMEGKTFATTSTDIFSDAHHDSPSYLDFVVNNSSNPRTSANYLVFTLPALYLFGYHQDAIVIGEDLISMTDHTWSVRLTLSTRFYLSLSYMAGLRDNLVAEREQKLQFVKDQLERIQKWSEVNDVNLVAWAHLLRAELIGLTGTAHNSMRSYEMALDHCEVHSFTFEHALASELYGEFLVRQGANRLARYSLRHAISTYQRISYFEKAKRMTTKHEFLFLGQTSLNQTDAMTQTTSLEHHPSLASPFETQEDPPSPKAKVANDGTADSVGESLSTEILNGTLPRLEALGLDMIDVTGILRSSQVLSSELQLDILLSTMAKIIMESTGTELVAIIVEDQQQWTVGAMSCQRDVALPTGQSLDEVEDYIGKKVTSYCLRFKEAVFLRNVLQDERFSDVPDSYRKRNPEGKAVCAMPIIHRDECIGCVYMEGNSISPRNVTVLRLLLSSVSISIANANLFRKLEKVSASNSLMVQSQKEALGQARTAEKQAKEAQEEALENLRLKEEAAKAKSLFLANVSHELRSPLNGILGSNSLLKTSKLTSEQVEWVESIHVCADTLLQVINDILDFSKLEAGKMQIFSIPMNLSETINEVIRALSYGNSKDGVTTVVDLRFDENLVVKGDGLRLHQVLMNLLSNGYKFTPKGEVTVKAVVDWESEEQITVTISVQDTGIGIEESQIEKLFSPFSQADSTTSRSYGGTGLGLSICKAIIESMGGEIWLESEINVGTTVFFTLTFPKVANAAAESSGSKTPSSADPMAVFTPPEASGEVTLQKSPHLIGIQRDQLRICIAEDNVINSKIAVAYVRKLGFQCEAFPDGAKTVAAVTKAWERGAPFGLVIMDCQMPVLDGYEATRQIRQNSNPEINSIIIIAMTASAIRGDREKCIACGMNDYLPKPVRIEKLKEMIDSFVQPEEPLSPASPRKERG